MTPHALRAAGVDVNRLRRRDIDTIAYGIKVARSPVPVSQVDRLRQRAVLLAREREDCWISHSTAAVLRGWWLPRRHCDTETVHLSVRKTVGTYGRHQGMNCHRATRAPRQVHKFEDVLISSPELAWLELAGVMTIAELVALGDHLVRQPYLMYEGRHEPWASIETLRTTMDEASGMHGVKRARVALDRVRIGADSAQETALRLALVDAGLPEPELQVAPVEDDPWSPRADLGYRAQRIAIQYDGATHFTPEQAQRDQRRDNAFAAAGWQQLHFNSNDAREGFTRAAAQVRTMLSRSRA